jgi:hypothetical protein
MPCGLKPSTTGKEDFTGTTGTPFTIEMTGPDDSGLTIASMSYNKKTITAAPFTFDVAAGTKFIFIHFEALKPGAKLQVVENCGGGSTQLLEVIFFDPSNPGTGFEITGS